MAIRTPSCRSCSRFLLCRCAASISTFGQLDLQIGRSDPPSDQAAAHISCQVAAGPELQGGDVYGDEWSENILVAPQPELSARLVNDPSSEGHNTSRLFG